MQVMKCFKRTPQYTTLLGFEIFFLSKILQQVLLRQIVFLHVYIFRYFGTIGEEGS